MIVQSWPGPRRRFVSHPLPMCVERPGMMRFCRWPKNMSLQTTTVAAVLDRGEIDARSSVAAVVGSTSPCTRSRATPPSGKMLRRRCVTRAAIADREHVLRVARERRPRQDRAPLTSAARELLRRRRARDVARLDARALGIVAAEEARVDHDAAHDARCAEVDDRPIVARFAAATRFPAVHPLSALRVNAFAPLGGRRLEQPFLRREELVVRGDHGAAQCFGGEIDQLREVGHGVDQGACV